MAGSTALMSVSMSSRSTASAVAGFAESWNMASPQFSKVEDADAESGANSAICRWTHSRVPQP